jgi:hypothetical protein
MARSRGFEVHVSTGATPAAVYRLLADAPSWKTWAGPLIAQSQWEVAPGPAGVGAIRRLGRRPMMVREEITAAEPPHHHGYRLLSGQPVRSYRADVIIEETASGSRISWTGSVVPLIPGTGRLMQVLLRRMVHTFAVHVAAAAETLPTPAVRRPGD